MLILFLTAYITAQFTWFPFSIQSGMSATLFVYVGYCAKTKIPNIYDKVKAEKITLMISFAVWAVDLFFSYYHDNMSVVRSYFPDLIINVTGACAASYIIIFLCKKLDHSEIISKRKLWKTLYYIGENSLLFLCFHLIELEFMPWHVLTTLPVPSILMKIVIFLLKICWGILGVYMMNRYAFLKKIFI